MEQLKQINNFNFFQKEIALLEYLQEDAEFSYFESYSIDAGKLQPTLKILFRLPKMSICLWQVPQEVIRQLLPDQRNTCRVREEPARMEPARKETARMQSVRMEPARMDMDGCDG